MKFLKPSKIQERALPLLLNNPPKNLVGQSQSGTGKTAAFVLNILSRLDLSTPQSQATPQALIVAPTRELARQIVGVIQVMGQFLDGLVIGTAVPADTNARPAKMDCSVVVGTPGTVIDLIRRRVMAPNQIKVLVLDEADNMLDQQGLGDQCIRVKGSVVLPPLQLAADHPDCCRKLSRSFSSPPHSLPMCTGMLASSRQKPTKSRCAMRS